jgi:curved DNA-binding protein CbpA
VENTALTIAINSLEFEFQLTSNKIKKMSQDYYRTLGVLDEAELIVIKAAYKALAQRYHPDKWQGDKDEANRRMSEINEAYAVLSDLVKRKEYDSLRDQHSYQENPEQPSTNTDDPNASIEDDWLDVIGFYPDLIKVTSSLSKISLELAFSYKLYMLSSKDYPNRLKIAQAYEANFLSKYFGTNLRIINFAKLLIQAKHKAAAKELNRAITLLGNNPDVDLVIDRINKKYSLGMPSPENDGQHIDKMQRQIKNVSIYRLLNEIRIETNMFRRYKSAKKILGLLGFEFRTKIFSFGSSVYITKDGEKQLLKIDECINFAIDSGEKHIRTE